MWVLFLSFFFLPVGKNVALCASPVARNSSLLVSVFPIHSASWFFQIPFNYTARWSGCFPCGPTARSESPCSWSRFVKSDIASIISLRLIFFFLSNLALHLSLAGNSGHLTWVRAALPIPNSACGIFVSPNKGMAASAWGLLRARRC